MSISPCAQTIAEYFAAIRNADIERYVSLFASGGVCEDPVGTPPHIGHDALRQYVTSILSGWRALTINEDGVFVRNDSAAVKWIVEGTGWNGKHVTCEGIDLFECSPEGKILSIRAYWDPEPVIAALQS